MLASLTSSALAVTQIALGVITSSPVLFDGCVETGPGPECVVGNDARLTLWIEDTGADAPQTTFNGRPLAAHKTAVDGGTRLVLTLPATAGTLILGDTQSARLRLSIRPAATTASNELNLAALGALPADEALATLNQALATATPAERTELLRTKARLHTRRDEHAIAQGVFRAAIANARTQGQHYTAVKSATALAFSLRQHQRDTTMAETAIEEVADLVGPHGASRYLWLYHRGLVAFTAENVRDQLRYFEQAVSAARRMDQPARELRADTLLAVVQQSLGQRKAAGTRLATWVDRLPPDLPGCQRAWYWNNSGWNALLALEAQERSRNPIPLLEKALRLSDEYCTATERINMRLNLGLAHWHQGDLPRAQRFLDAAQSLTQSPATHLALWAIDLDGRIRAARADYDGALERFSTLAQRAEAAGQPATTWRARVREAWTLRLAGRDVEAIDVHRAAERTLDDQVLRVPLQAGRETLLATRRFAMREHLGLLHKHQRFDEALALMRRESSRAIEQLHVAARLSDLDVAQRDAWDQYRQQYESIRAADTAEQTNGWQLSQAQLAALNRRSEKRQRQLQQLLDQGVASLHTAKPAQIDSGRPRAGKSAALLGIWQTRDGWSVLLDTESGVRGFSPNCPAMDSRDSRDTIATCLLDAVADDLSTADSVALLVDDVLADVDWHALPSGDAQWVDQLALRYVSGLPATTRATPGPGLALIVGDPGGNLDAARREVDDVQHHLSASGAWRDDTLLGELADRNAVRSRLANAALFHYAGHAVFGNNSGWDSALLLANQTRLSIGDILTLDATPQLVVLSGCETARRSGVTTPAIGLAHAFLARGSSAVLATTRSVDDRSARAVVSAFYHQWLAGESVHQALRSAQRQTRDQHPELDWAAFRIIEP